MFVIGQISIAFARIGCAPATLTAHQLIRMGTLGDPRERLSALAPVTITRSELRRPAKPAHACTAHADGVRRGGNVR